MLFDSLFKNDKGITIGNRRKRKLTASDVIGRLNKFDLATANCTLIRDHLGNDKIEDYGQVDIFRIRDEEIFSIDNAFFITTPTGMKFKGEVGNFDVSEKFSTQSPHEIQAIHDEISEKDQDETSEKDREENEDREESLMPLVAEEIHEDGNSDQNKHKKKQHEDNAFSETTPSSGTLPSDAQEYVLGVGQVIRLRFFHRRIPYEIDCQIIDRFAPSRLKEDVDLTPRFGVGYRVRPLTDVRNRDKRRYVRYTHRVGFGHLRLRSEIHFHVFVHRTNLEIPNRGALSPTLTYDDFKVFPYATPEVPEVKGAERLEDIVEFYMRCMVNNPTERRHVYISKHYYDNNRHKPSLEGLMYYTTVGAQQATVLPKIFIKKPLKGKTVLERMLATKGKGPRDTHKMRVVEELEDRYSLLTRERKVSNARRRQKRVEVYDNDTCFASFITSYGLSPGDMYAVRPISLNCELTDMGVENLTLKPTPFDDNRARQLDVKEFARQEDGFPVELLNFSVGGAQIRGGEEEDKNEAFFKFLIGETHDKLNLKDRIEALRKFAVLLHFYPVLTFVRSQIQEYEPYLPFKIPVIARVARFGLAKASEHDEPKIMSIGLEFIFNPMLDAYSRDLNVYDKWEQITPYTENQYFIAVHKSLQLLFGFDRALDEVIRDDRTPKDKDDKKDTKNPESDASAHSGETV